MSAVLRLLSRSSVTNDIFRCIRTKSPGVLQQMRCRTSSASGEFSTDSRLLIGGGVCVVGAALAVRTISCDVTCKYLYYCIIYLYYNTPAMSVCLSVREICRLAGFLRSSERAYQLAEFLRVLASIN